MAFVVEPCPGSGRRHRGRDVKKDEGLRYSVLAQRLTKDRRVHRLVEEDAGGGLGDEAGPRQRPAKKSVGARATARVGREIYNERLTASGVMWRGPGAARWPAAV